MQFLGHCWKKYEEIITNFSLFWCHFLLTVIVQCTAWGGWQSWQQQSRSMSQRKIRVTTRTANFRPRGWTLHCHFVDLNPLQFSKPTWCLSLSIAHGVYIVFSMKPVLFLTFQMIIMSENSVSLVWFFKKNGTNGSV